MKHERAEMLAALGTVEPPIIEREIATCFERDKPSPGSPLSHAGQTR